MDLLKLVALGNSLADDQIPHEEVAEFVNDAISAINIEVNATFPFLVADTDEPKFPEDWQRMLIVPYVKARIKEKDSSQFEWEIAYEQFFANLESFKAKYKIPDQYKNLDSNGDVSDRSLLDNQPYFWGGW